MLVLSRTPAFAATTQITQDQPARKQTQDQVNPQLFKHSLSGLYGIESFKLNVNQPYNNFKQLYSQSLIAQKELETICQSTALLSNAQPLFSGVKSKQRAQEKIRLDLNGDNRKITDIARATILAHDIDGLVTAYENLNKQTKILGVKNRFKTPAPSGYRDLNLLVELPETKIIAEVQLHLTEIEKVKSGPEHDFYEIIQGIERRAIAESRELNEIETAKIANLRRESHELYRLAWQPYITTNLKAA